MVRYSTILILVFALAASAQNWEWEQYEGDFYNPTGFPQHEMLIGDYDGDGQDEFLNRRADGFDIFSLDLPEPPLHWSKYTGDQVLGSIIEMRVNVANVDSDAADEVILFEDFGVAHCWKAVSGSPWTWEQRDDLLAAYDVPEPAISMAVGDIDGDGLAEAAYTLAVDCICAVIEIQEYDGSSWSVDSTIEEYAWDHPNLFAGDFDNDGDIDLGMNSTYIDTHPFLVLIENIGSGLGSPIIVPRFSGYGGGDIDHDGAWEGVRFSMAWERETCEIIEWSGLGIIADSVDMTAFNGQIIGNLRADGESFIAGFVPWTRDTPEGYSEQTFWRYYSEGGWQDLDLGIPIDDGKTLSLGWGDLNNDGLNDMLREVQRFNFQVVPVFYIEWEIRVNEGDESHDDYSTQTSTLDWLTENPDTLLSNPQLGDLNQDGFADLFVIGEPTSAVSQVLIYRTDIDHGLFLEPSWSLGLPTGVVRIHTADIDNDGFPELMLKQVDWHVYFFRNGHWQDYSDILPEFESNEIGFADFDNDGDLDLFTDEDVWISLSPSPVFDPPLLSPLSFVLSAYPNPFNPVTTLIFDLPIASRVVLDVYNIAGQKVQSITDRPYSAGTHAIEFDGSGFSTGIYFARLTAGTTTHTTKLLLTK